jgi:ACR3 family arsenite efflux pump ArsB
MSEESGLNRFESSQPAILIAAMLLGLIIGPAFSGIAGISNSIVYLSLVGLMFGIALGTPLRSVAKSYARLKFFGIAWSVNFIIVPLVGFLLASIFLSGTPLIFLGFILYVVTPCTDWFLVFTGMAKGDVSLGLALLPTQLVLQILLIPVYLFLFAGEIVPFQLAALVETVIIFIVLPFAFAILTNRAIVRTKGAVWKERRLKNVPIAIQTLTLAIAIFFMFAGQTQVIIDNAGALAIVLLPVLIFFAISYAISHYISRWLRLRYEECALLTCTSIARNSPLALAIAFGLFPNLPLVQVAIIIGVIVELPVLVLVVKSLNKGRPTYCGQGS